MSQMHPSSARLTRRQLLQAGVAAALPMGMPGTRASRAGVRPSHPPLAHYVRLIRCVGPPAFCAPTIGSGGFRGAPHTPLFVGSATNHPAMPGFRAPDDLQPAVGPERLRERRDLLDV